MKEIAIKLFPTIQMLSCVGACTIYTWYGEWRQALYWFFAAGLTAVVTYLLK
jgi:hypothetical protein